MGALTFLAVGDDQTARVKAPLRTGAESSEARHWSVEGKVDSYFVPNSIAWVHEANRYDHD